MIRLYFSYQLCIQMYTECFYGTFYVEFLFSALTVNIVNMEKKVVWLVVYVYIECFIPITWKRICSTATNRFNKIMF